MAEQRGSDRSTTGAPGHSDALLAADRSDDADTMARKVALLGSAVAVASQVQVMLVLGPIGGLNSATGVDMEAVRWLFVNLATVAAATLAASRMRIQEHKGARVVVLLLGAAAAVVMTRALLQLAIGIFEQTEMDRLLSSNALAFAMTVLLFTLALRITRGKQQVRFAERTHTLPATIAADALIRMQRDELRQRYTEADALRRMVHDRTTRLDDDLQALEVELVGRRAGIQLEAVRQDLADLVDRGLASLTSTVYPAGIEQGLVTAVRALASRVPDTVKVTVSVDQALAEAERSSDGPLGLPKRLLIVRLAEEGIANALRHGHALSIDIALGLENGVVRMVVSDAGRGVELPARLRTLGELRTQIERVNGRLHLGVRPGGGTRLALVLPVAGVRTGPHRIAGTSEHLSPSI